MSIALKLMLALVLLPFSLIIPISISYYVITLFVKGTLQEIKNEQVPQDNAVALSEKIQALCADTIC